ncbi:hypothetical protein [Couchioplanes azureus]|uniref:hypothetical protein n=1 Tax=Couchioplanes caeruleus TaxID=56438 RepID=UPI0016711182|nr:hypothetical protein [Couchioplanes caeruleus]GGQ67971.1 hypothetical protein GCM10010166_42460 [Couchioplanes caeruleus subsp. azureus]
MFGRRRRTAELTARLDRMEEQLRRVLDQTAGARPLLADAQRLAKLAAEARALSDATATTVEGLQALLAGTGIDRPRLHARVNRVYRAESLGYVAVFFRGGRTDDVRLLVGRDKPPQECIGEANTRNELNSYVGGVIRAGEYWTVEAKFATTSSYGCVFTPLL